VYALEAAAMASWTVAPSVEKNLTHASIQIRVTHIRTQEKMQVIKVYLKVVVVEGNRLNHFTYIC
jgi:hypothetical protein